MDVDDDVDLLMANISLDDNEVGDGYSSEEATSDEDTIMCTPDKQPMSKRHLHSKNGF